MYKPESWRDDYSADADLPGSPSASNPSVHDQCRLLDLLGRINYKIISGKRVYVEVEDRKSVVQGKSVGRAGSRLTYPRHGCWRNFFFSSRRRHTRCSRDWSSDVCSYDLVQT